MRYWLFVMHLALARPREILALLRCIAKDLLREGRLP